MDAETTPTLEELASASYREHQSKIFHDEVARLMGTHLTIIEAIAHYCEERDMDVEVMVPYISSKMRSEITDEAIEHNLIQRKYQPRQLSFE